MKSITATDRSSAFNPILDGAWVLMILFVLI